MVAPRNESGLLDEIRLERPEFHWRLESIRREHRMILGQPGSVLARHRPEYDAVAIHSVIDVPGTISQVATVTPDSPGTSHRMSPL